MRTAERRWVIPVLLIPLALTLSGCFGGPTPPGVPAGPGVDDIDEELIEQIVENGSGEEFDFEVGELPADFPVDDVPLIGGDVSTAFVVPATEGTRSWQVAIHTAVANADAQAPALLSAAGYSNESMFGWENESYLVVIVSVTPADGGGSYVQYLVSEK